ncbi:hypothetical protein MRB53_039736 [Persea americana]|nr:hypothetical protein MRB53_039736 [Persea americana]
MAALGQLPLRYDAPLLLDTEGQDIYDYSFLQWPSNAFAPSSVAAGALPASGPSAQAMHNANDPAREWTYVSAQTYTPAQSTTFQAAAHQEYANAFDTLTGRSFGQGHSTTLQQAHLLTGALHSPPIDTASAPFNAHQDFAHNDFPLHSQAHIPALMSFQQRPVHQLSSDGSFTWSNSSPDGSPTVASSEDDGTWHLVPRAASQMSQMQPYSPQDLSNTSNDIVYPISTQAYSPYLDASPSVTYDNNHIYTPTSAVEQLESESQHHGLVHDSMHEMVMQMPSGYASGSSFGPYITSSASSRTPDTSLVPPKTTRNTITKHSPPKTAISQRGGKGKRSGPLSLDKREAASQIRKLGACLRCKFLKKTCDPQDICQGCKPSHVRLWTVPCTRLDVRDLHYFMKHYNSDYGRHLTNWTAMDNLKSLDPDEFDLFISHGYDVILPLRVRTVTVRNQKAYEMSWTEVHDGLTEHKSTQTANLAIGADGISDSVLHNYLESHLNEQFDAFLDANWTPDTFLHQMLRIAQRYWLETRNRPVYNALKMLVAYLLTTRITMVEGAAFVDGKIVDQDSRFTGRTLAPNLVNFAVKKQLSEIWRESHEAVLQDLSKLYTGVYTGDKVKNWPVILMITTIILSLWELMQFDVHYHTVETGKAGGSVISKAAADDFCREMEATPLGVVVGLFAAISQKMPPLREWQQEKHSGLVSPEPAVVQIMNETCGLAHKNGERGAGKCGNPH